ncbi:hypothetical protein CEXT_652301 [Caerostris extrusa]|uniref:Uncharacterized protein n=1 Tax=Caerostris extrusa TaxID=172846 RepID=A0AAV4Y812_CAEEX|nr:hypothetical protein CEXT_652301 [Caerostris extrusa]
MGTDVHIPQSVRTPSHEACQLNEVECAEILLKYEANINTFNKHNETALYNSYWKGSIACTELLLKMDADVRTSRCQNTLLHKACLQDKGKSLESRLRKGEKFNHENSECFGG